MVRNILAVVIGYALWSGLWIGAGEGIKAASPQSILEDGTVQSSGILLVILAASVVISLVSGYCAAVIARAKPFGPVLILGLALLATGIPIQMSVWDRMPVWYHLTFLILLVPGVLVGSNLRRKT